MQAQFFFCPLSRYSYLASTQLAEISKETGVIFDWIPINFDKLSDKRNRGRSLDQINSIQNSPSYIMRDVQRWAKYYKVHFVEVADRFPVDKNVLTLACTAARVMSASQPFATELMHYIHATQGRLVGEKECLDAAARAGLSRELFRVCMHDSRTSLAHESALSDAIAFDVFAEPSFTVGTELFVGHERLPLLRDYLHSKVSSYS